MCLKKLSWCQPVKSSFHSASCCPAREEETGTINDKWCKNGKSDPPHWLKSKLKQHLHFFLRTKKIQIHIWYDKSILELEKLHTLLSCVTLLKHLFIGRKSRRANEETKWNEDRKKVNLYLRSAVFPFSFKYKFCCFSYEKDSWSLITSATTPITITTHVPITLTSKENADSRICERK